MAGWRVGFMLGNAEVIAALARLKSYLDYGTFQPIQIAATVTMNERPEHPVEVCRIYESRRDALCDGLGKGGVGDPEAARNDVRLGADPERRTASSARFRFAEHLAREAHVAVSPGIGFGPDGDGFVRFALVENEQRIRQAVRAVRRLPGLSVILSGRRSRRAPPAPR